ncbi:hypothetical protein, partial [Polaribacter sp.]|uniref:hypothetical protein n=1 Tax=Polaribacter sp. TaxID=1920175 RepID=UPI0040477B17
AFMFLYVKNSYFCDAYVSKMYCFSDFVRNQFLEKKDYTAFWKCHEKTEISPLTFLKELQRYFKLHVVYLQIIQ